MTDRLHVDPVVLDAIADRLSRAGQALDAAGAAAPDVPDAGTATPIVAGLLATLIESAANLAGGLQAAGVLVSEARQTYAAQDDQGGQIIRGAL